MYSSCVVAKIIQILVENRDFSFLTCILRLRRNFSAVFVARKVECGLPDGEKSDVVPGDLSRSLRQTATLLLVFFRQTC